MTRQAKLKWHCRRGMLELDLLLEEFLEHRYSGLSQADRDEFARLLDCENEALMAWLLQGETPPEAGLANLVSRILERAEPEPEA